MAIPTFLDGVDTTGLRKHCDRRKERLKIKRQPWFDFCKQVANELLPNRLPYLVDPHSLQRGGEQNTHIVDAVGHLSLDTAAAGVTTGTMPPTATWFHLSTRGDFDHDDDDRLYLEENARRMLAMHDQSNAANVVPEGHKEWLAFGTAAALIVEDDEDHFRLDGMSVGEYLIADDKRGRVDTCYRELTLTVGQLAEEFGLDRLSPSSHTAYDLGDFDQSVACVHAIEPDRDGKNPRGQNRDQPWRSVYYEDSSSWHEVLDVRGYDKFPVLVWRAGKLPGSTYGYGRGHDVLPHLIRLRKLIYRYGQALAFKSEPPLQIPAGMQQHEVRGIPGGRSSVFGQQPIRTLFDVQLELKEVSEEIERTRQGIRDTLGATLVASLRRLTQQMTKREAELRTSQDLAEFLPGLARLNEELLSPYVEWLWDIGMATGQLLPPPESFAGKAIDIEFTSPLARRQRESEVDAIVQTYAIAGEIAKVRPDIVDNLDPDTAIRKIAQIKGAPTDTLTDPEAMQRDRKARAEAMLAEKRAAAAQQAADIAETGAHAQQMSPLGNVA